MHHHAVSQFDFKTPTFFSRPDRLADPLYVVTPVINAARFRSRWKNFADFAKHVAEAGAILYVIEVAFGDREFVVTSPDNPRHIQMRTFHELWLKERAVNLAVARLPADWRYVAWVDADCLWVRHDWADETRHALQHHPIIQMWSQIMDLTPNYESYGLWRSFMDIQLNGPTGTAQPGEYYGEMKVGAGQKFGSPGLAWACRREAWNQLGGLIDYCILGAGDWYFANAVWGTLDAAISQRNDLTGPFMQKMVTYQEHARRAYWEGRSVVGNIGMMRGLVAHYWHGGRANRGYNTRGEILMRHKFDPEKDLIADWQGLYQLSNRNPELRREIQAYFHSRCEDSIDVKQ